MSDKEFQCSSCIRMLPRADFHETAAHDRLRVVTSQCRDCRSDAYYKRRYPDSKCDQCLKHRPVNSNKICKGCNEDSGIRECRGCRQVKSALLEFYGEKTVCRQCSKATKAPKASE